ncbi:helix-turn-helix domain-containing protein [Anaerocolumna sedimenticola]|uniref:Helix-turn-helix domain-containing protein n=1 Tax=Anaerocolumna sedimenticola TaxID=2696063 RepID=A0A6P1TQZ9_9FIRM|nr:AraC family transcriptional regulator [Anaerocolumna sedimenticola]QHQ62321.1 helix-turn-helix domain-containing protein [Anaerocolumna sedimenticola]
MTKRESAYVVQRVQNYIERNITKPITMKQLSIEAGYSSWYLARTFKEVTGKGIFEYIRSRRLTQAALILRDENKKVIDVALDFVFDSQEGFTRAFSREFGIAPGRYKSKTPPIKLFLPEKAYDTYRAFHNSNKMDERMENMTKSIFVQIIERPERKCLLKRGKKAEDYFEYCEEVGCDVWSLLSSVKEALYEPIGMWLPSHFIPEDTSSYIQGVELPMDYDKNIPDGYELIILPPCTMMVFQGEPYNDEDFQYEIGEVWKHIEKFNPEVYGYQWAPEQAPRFQLAPMGYRGYIEARPVVKCNK